MTSKNSFSSVFGDAFWLIAIRVGGMLCGMLLMVVLARLMTPQDLGYYAMGMSTALLAGLACSANFGAGAVRFLSEYRSKSDHLKSIAYVQVSRKIVIFGAVIFSILGCVAWLASWYGQANTSFKAIPLSIVIALFAAPLLALLRNESANVHALGYVLRSSLPNMLLRPVLLLSSVFICTYFGQAITATFVMSLVFATLVIIAVVQFFMFRPILSFMPTTVANSQFVTQEKVGLLKKGLTKEWLSVGVQLVVPVLFLEFSIDTIVLMAALVLPAQDVAVLSVTLRLQAIILFGVTSINMAVGPKLAKAYNDDEYDNVRKLLAMSGHLKFWPSLIVLAVMYFIGEWVLGIFGTYYAEYKHILIILSLSPLVLAFYGPTVLFMTLMGLQRKGSVVFFASILLLAILVVIMGHFFGLEGVAWSAVFVWCVWNHILNKWILSHGNIDTSIMAR